MRILRLEKRAFLSRLSIHLRAITVQKQRVIRPYQRCSRVIAVLALPVAVALFGSLFPAALASNSSALGIFLGAPYVVVTNVLSLPCYGKATRAHTRVTVYACTLCCVSACMFTAPEACRSCGTGRTRLGAG